MWRFCDLKQNGAGLQVSDFKADKVYTIDVVLWFTEVTYKTRERQFLTLWTKSKHKELTTDSADRLTAPT